jgi:hypothetical protein
MRQRWHGNSPEHAVDAARGLGDDRLLIKALAELCSAHFFAGQPYLGLPFGQESVERARHAGPVACRPGH